MLTAFLVNLPVINHVAAKIWPKWICSSSESCLRVNLLLEWVFSRSGSSIGVSLLLEWVFSRSGSSIGVSLFLEWVFSWSESSLGVSLLSEWVFLEWVFSRSKSSWSESSLGVNLLLEWVFSWSESSLGVSLLSEWVFLEWIFSRSDSDLIGQRVLSVTLLHLCTLAWVCHWIIKTIRCAMGNTVPDNGHTQAPTHGNCTCSYCIVRMCTYSTYGMCMHVSLWPPWV